MPETEAGDVQVLQARLRHALRRTRDDRYAVVVDGGRLRICVTVQASPAGRHNVAAHIVTALGQQGLRLVADDPVEALSTPDSWCDVASAETDGSGRADPR